MRHARDLAGLVLVATLVLLALAGPASAHVTVHSADARAGGYAVLTFRVPTESSTASTTRLAVRFQTAHPIASVLVEPRPGWTAKVTTGTLATPVRTPDGDTLTQAVTEVVWTADSAATAIKPGQFDQFPISAGPLPAVTTLTFSAIQTYSDGTVVSWNQVAAPGSGATPTHPRPVLTLAPAESVSPTANSTAARRGAGGGGDTAALTLAVIALVVAAGALGLAVVTRARQAGR